MPSKRTVLSRRELYELVWSKPMSKLAQEYGLSDRGLAKLCSRHRVPVPPRGYWAKLSAGVHVTKPAFLELRDRSLDQVTVRAPMATLPSEIVALRSNARSAARRSAHAPSAESIGRVSSSAIPSSGRIT